MRLRGNGKVLVAKNEYSDEKQIVLDRCLDGARTEILNVPILKPRLANSPQRIGQERLTPEIKCG